MPDFDSGFEGDELTDLPDEEIEKSIRECRELIESGLVFGSLEKIEDVIQLCVENEFAEDGLFLITGLLEISPYNSEYW